MGLSDRTLKADLGSGPRIGIFHGMRDVQAAALLARAGWKMVLIDTEHVAIGPETLHTLVLAVRAWGMAAVIRLRDSERSTVQTALETGADGILAPMCESVTDAERFVQFARFPPQGSRGFHGMTAASSYGSDDPATYVRRANAEVLIGVQIETLRGLEACETIARVPGLDLVFTGTGDLSVQMGRPGIGDDPELRAAVGRVCDAAEDARIMSGLYSSRESMIQFGLERGARFLACGSDTSLFLKASLRQYETFAALARR